MQENKRRLTRKLIANTSVLAATLCRDFRVAHAAVCGKPERGARRVAGNWRALLRQSAHAAGARQVGANVSPGAARGLCAHRVLR